MPFASLRIKSTKAGSSPRSGSNALKTNRPGIFGEGFLKVGERRRSGIVPTCSPVLAHLSTYFSPAELRDNPPPAYTQYPEVFNVNYHRRYETSEKFKKSPFISTGNKGIEDDPYGFLTDFDTVFLIDDSGSMRGKSWKEVEAAL